MQISLNWINELVDIENIKLDKIIEKLTLGGFEVEEILEIQKQITLDISATANRSDSLSIQGISTEIMALLDKPVNISIYVSKSNNLKQKILKEANILTTNKDWNILSSIVIENLNDIKPPKWITQKLINSGISPENTLLDFQNYILLETGYPFIFYDLDKIKAKLNNSKFSLSISNAEKNQKFTARNGITYELDESILVTKANDLNIGIAGIIEDQEFSYSNTTTSLLIEGNIFNAAKIRQQSRHLGLRTDISIRSEKSLTSTYLIEAFYRLISLLRITNPNLKCELHSIIETTNKTVDPILLREKSIYEILGPINLSKTKQLEYLTPKIIENYLNRLNFTFAYDETNQAWEVGIPDYRTTDIGREIDLIEEIGRLHGFNNFLITLPKLHKIGVKDISYQTRKKITNCLLNLGFTELIHYSLVNETTFINNEIELVNPLVSEYSNLRISLLPNLIKTVQENLKQGNSIINGFEYGHVFLLDSQEEFYEKEYIAGIFGGFKTKLDWSNYDTNISWFEAKGKMEQLFMQLNLSIKWEPASNNLTNNLMHFSRNTDLYLDLANKTKLGVFGQINPILANKLNLPIDLYLFELNLQVIQNQLEINQLDIYKNYSLYPKIIKDISFIIDQKISFNEIKEVIYYNGTKFLIEVNLLDEYKGSSIPNKHISLCLQLIFQSKEATLQNKEIEKILTRIQNILIQKFNVIIRT